MCRLNVSRMSGTLSSHCTNIIIISLDILHVTLNSLEQLAIAKYLRTDIFRPPGPHTYSS
jgi:hypothetical protein